MKKTTIIISVSEILFYIVPIVVQFLSWRFLLLRNNTSLDGAQKYLISFLFTVVGTLIYCVIMTFNWDIKW